MAIEPERSLQQTPVKMYWLATRPAFLSASLVTAILGVSAAAYQGHAIKGVLFILTLLATALVHAAMNVLNDYYDEVNGTDRRNTLRVFPFTGGSRFIQNGVLSAQATLNFAKILLLAVIALGLLLVAFSSGQLVIIGLLGLVLGWAYSAPPLRLNSRGWGELTIAVSFGVLTPLGAWVVQTGTVASYPVWVSLPAAFLVMNILYMNQFPDYEADAASGKHHWVVRLGLVRAPYVYSGVVFIAALILLGLIILRLIPTAAFWSILPLALAVGAAYRLHRYASQSAYLAPAIKLTIATLILHSLILSAVLWLYR